MRRLQEKGEEGCRNQRNAQSIWAIIQGMFKLCREIQLGRNRKKIGREREREQWNKERNGANTPYDE